MLAIAVSLLLGCTVGDDLPPSQVHDLQSPADLGPLPPPPSDLLVLPGSVGLACTKDSSCTAGTSPHCWTANIADQPGNLPTQNGYCTSTCSTDKDCGAFGTCQNVLGANYCLESCQGAGGCRVSEGYACFVLTSTSGYCFPSALLTCNPTAGSGTCTTNNQPGGCVREAFDDLGACHQTCALGTSTCPTVTVGVSQQRQHCIYINATRDTNGVATRDKYQGTACFVLGAQPGQENSACQYFDDCQDGLQCNLTPGGDHKCRALCKVGVVGACSDTTKVCKDVFNAGLGNPGLCVSP